MTLIWCLCAILILLILALLIKLRLLQKSMDEIRRAFAEKLETDTNTLISISTRDPHARALAADINTQLRLLRQERQRYQTGDRELTEAVTNISHDLRTPLTAICGYLEFLEQEEQSERVRFYLSQIENRTEVLKQLTEELFRYSVIVSVNDSASETVLLNRALEESLVSHYAALTSRGITPEIDITDTPVSRTLSPSALNRVFSNVIGNALKYSDGDLQVSLTESGVISFTNSAKALNPVMTARLFDRFYTVESASGSTGLGLSIAKLLTERMGGSIDAEYHEGKLTIRISFKDTNSSQVNK